MSWRAPRTTWSRPLPPTTRLCSRRCKWSWSWTKWKITSWQFTLNLSNRPFAKRCYCMMSQSERDGWKQGTLQWWVGADWGDPCFCGSWGYDNSRRGVDRRRGEDALDWACKNFLMVAVGEYFYQTSFSSFCWLPWATVG